jgi:thiamine biosynthesis lipoprotein
MSSVERFDAMGTWVEVRTEIGDGHEATRRLFADVESRCTRFDSASELSRLNAAPPGLVHVSPDLAAVLRVAERLRLLTGGLVDAGIGSRVIEWGYDRTFSDLGDGIPVPDQIDVAPQWTVDGQTVVRGEGVRLDLGGVAKGWTADRAVEAGYARVVSAGGDIRSDDPATVVVVVDPWGGAAAHLALGVGGLATSSVGRRRWSTDLGGAHHIIDPRTGDPADTPVVSATVVADTAAEAEAAAKTVLILGTRGLVWAADQSWVRAAVAVWHDGNVFATPGVELAA